MCVCVCVCVYLRNALVSKCLHICSNALHIACNKLKDHRYLDDPEPSKEMLHWLFTLHLFQWKHKTNVKACEVGYSFKMWNKYLLECKFESISFFKFLQNASVANICEKLANMNQEQIDEVKEIFLSVSIFFLFRYISFNSLMAC